MSEWNYDRVIEAARELDAERLAAGDMRPLTIGEFKHNPALPSAVTLERHVGSMDELQRALGRVTTKLALEWDEDTWRDNAQWAQAILERDSGTQMTQKTITKFASAGLMPNMRVIDSRWGNVVAYRSALGIERRSMRIEAASWTKEQSIENGKRFSRSLGVEFGLDIMPVRTDMVVGIASDQLPTVSQIIKLHGSTEQFQADLGFVNIHVLEGWTQEQWQQNFAWLRDVFEQQDMPFVNLKDILTKAGALHLGPSPDLVTKYWGNLSTYGKEMGFDSKYYKRTLPDEGIIRAAINETVRLGRPLTQADLDEHELLGPNQLKSRFGGIGELNARLGFTSRALGWDRSRVSWWAVTDFMQREGHIPSYAELSKCGARKVGPSANKVLTVFDSMEDFRTDLKRANTWFEDQVSQLSAVHRLPEALFRGAIRRDPSLFRVGEKLGRSDFELFFTMHEAGVDVRAVALMMVSGISFTRPVPHLNWLAETLDRGSMLNSSVLRKLSTYIVGLAPPEPEVSWSDFIVSFRRRS